MNAKLRACVVSAEARGFCLLCGCTPCECEKRQAQFEADKRARDLALCIEDWQRRRSEVDTVKLR